MRVKFRVESVTNMRNGKQGVALHAVHDETIPPDQRFLTDQAFADISIDLGSVELPDQLRLGRCYYVDFTDAPDEQPLAQ